MPISRINQSKKRHNNFSPATPHKKRAEGPKQGAVQDPNPLEANVWYSESPATPRILGGAHAVCRQATSAAWVDLLPKLVYPLMVWAQCGARNNLDPLANAGSEDFACHCGATRSSYCWIISFQSLYFSLGILQCKLNGEPRYWGNMHQALQLCSAWGCAASEGGFLLYPYPSAQMGFWHCIAGLHIAAFCIWYSKCLRLVSCFSGISFG